MQKKIIFYVISSFFLVSCETKSDIRTANEISSIRANIADSFIMIENFKDEMQILKGELETQSVKQEKNIELDQKYLSLKEENELIKKNIEELKINFETEINNMKEEFNKAIDKLKESLLSNSRTKVVEKNNDDISSLDIDTRYKKGLELYNAKKHEEALVYFKSIVGSKSKWYDERARFYSGNALYNLARFEEAIVEMHDFSNKYSKSIFISKALMVQADSFLKLNMKNEAKSTFQEIINKFPNSSEANLAKQKVAKL